MTKNIFNVRPIYSKHTPWFFLSMTLLILPTSIAFAANMESKMAKVRDIENIAFLQGVWQGSVTERGKKALLQLDLWVHEGNLKGILRMLSETGKDVTKGMAFDIVQAEITESTFNFMVPVSGQIDNDTLVFKLKITGDQLIGTGREMRKGSHGLPITFIKRHDKEVTVVRKPAEKTWVKLAGLEGSKKMVKSVPFEMTTGQAKVRFILEGEKAAKGELNKTLIMLFKEGLSVAEAAKKGLNKKKVFPLKVVSGVGPGEYTVKVEPGTYTLRAYSPVGAKWKVQVYQRK